jgi:hypothetical protein
MAANATAETAVPTAAAAAEPEPEAAKPAGAALPKTYRAKTEAIRRTRSAAVAGVVWGALGAAVVALVVSAGLFRVEVVRLWPRTAGAYAKVGLTVNPTGLAPENILAGPGLKNGHAAVIVSGVVRNVESRSNDPAPLRVALLDKGGKTLATQIIHISAGRLQPGQTRPFSTAFIDPPSAAANVQVEFALDVKPPPHGKEPAKGHGDGHGKPAPAAHGEEHGAAPAAGHGEAHPPAQDEAHPPAHGEEHGIAEAHPPQLRGRAEPSLPPMPAPKVAQPLPADSPYALPAAAQANTHRPHEG